MREQAFQSPVNQYSIGAATGVLTVVAAATASAGHLFAARFAPSVVGNPPFPRFARITLFQAQWVTLTGFTAAQEVGLDLSIVRGYTASHSAGTAITLPTAANANTNKKRSVGAVPPAVAQDSAMTSIQIATTGALTNGTETFDATPIRQSASWELATGATIPVGTNALLYKADDLPGAPIELVSGEGLVLRNRILMGAGGTARVIVTMEWAEVVGT